VNIAKLETIPKLNGLGKIGILILPFTTIAAPFDNTLPFKNAPAPTPTAANGERKVPEVLLPAPRLIAPPATKNILFEVAPFIKLKTQNKITNSYINN